MKNCHITRIINLRRCESSNKVKRIKNKKFRKIINY